MAVGQFPVGSAEGGQDLVGMLKIEQIDEGDIRVRFQVDLQLAHEPAGGQPEIIPDQHDRLEVLAVALPQGGDQLGVLLALPGEEPLLELVQHQEHLLARAERPPPPQRGQGLHQAQPGAQLRSRLAHPFEQPGLGLRRGRLDVNRPHLLGEAGKQPRLHQRRLAATRGTIDQTDPEGGICVGRLDPGLPEPEALGQAIAIARAGQELQEEVGIVLVERPQSLGDDLDRFTRGRILGGARRRVDRARGGGG